VPRQLRFDTGTEGGLTHAFKANWLFELPIGQGRRFASNAGPVLDRIIGGWQIHGVTRIQSGQLVNFGNVRMVGFDKNDLRDMYFYRFDADNRVTLLPDDVIENTVRAFSVSATSATGYSDLGVPEGRAMAAEAQQPLLRLRQARGNTSAHCRLPQDQSNWSGTSFR